MIKLSCKSCGAKLELTDDTDRFICGSCGNEWLVNKSGGAIYLSEIKEDIKNIKINTGATKDNTEILAIEAKIRVLKKKEEDLKKQLAAASFPYLPTSSCLQYGCVGVVLIFLLIALWIYNLTIALTIALPIVVVVILILFYEKGKKDKEENTKLQQITKEDEKRRQELNKELQEIRTEISELEKKILKT